MNANESKTKLVRDLNFSDEKIAKLEAFVNEVLNYNKNIILSQKLVKMIFGQGMF